MKKRIKRLIAVVVLLPVAVVAGAFIYIDAIAKAGVERGATYALGVTTTLDSMSVGVLRGRVELAGLDVANPAGFTSDRFMSLGEGRVGVTLGTLMEDTVVLPELRLTGLDVNLEKKGKDANYQVILDGLKKFESTGAPPAPSKEDPKKFVIQLVTVEDVNVQVELAGMGRVLTRLPLHLEKIELRDVGSETTGGMVLSQLTGLLTKAILEAIVQQGAGVLPDAITGELNRGLAALGGLGNMSIRVVGDVTTMVDGQVRKVADLGGQLLDSTSNSLDDVRKGVGDVGKGLDEGVGELNKGLGGLLRGQKTDDDKKDAEDE